MKMLKRSIINKGGERKGGMRGKRTKEAERGYGSSEGGEGESSDRMRAMTKVGITETKRQYLKLET